MGSAPIAHDGHMAYGNEKAGQLYTLTGFSIYAPGSAHSLCFSFTRSSWLR
jgi:hypothetical protein